MDVTDVAEDGSVYAHVSNGKLMIYDISNNKLLLSLKEKPQTKSKTKVLKISSKNTAVAWLRSCSNQLSLLSVIHIHSKTTTNIKSFNDYPFEYILWHPHEDHLAVFSTFSIFTDVYSLEHDREECITSISGAKFDDHGRPIAQFSPDGEYFAIVNVCNNGHAISVYCITNSSWIHIQRVLVTNCLDMGGMLWCQDSASLLVWQASAGLDLLLQLVTVDGRVEHTLHADAAPITSVCLSKCGRTAALHTSDARVRILDLLTWQFGSMGVLVHSPVIHKSSARSRLRTTADHNQPICVCEPITSTLCELNHDASRTGRLRLLQFNSDARYLATYEPVFPNILWLWDLVAKLPLDTVVKLADNVRVQGLRWHDDKDVLAATLSNNSVLVWTSQQTLIINQSDKLYPLAAETYLATLPQTATDEYCD